MNYILGLLFNLTERVEVLAAHCKSTHAIHPDPCNARYCEALYMLETGQIDDALSDLHFAIAAMWKMIEDSIQCEAEARVADLMQVCEGYSDDLILLDAGGAAYETCKWDHCNCFLN